MSIQLEWCTASVQSGSGDHSEWFLSIESLHTQAKRVRVDLLLWDWALLVGERILATRHSPPSKSSSKLIDDQNRNLFLFGGRSMICVDVIHHLREQLHSELRSYSMERNTWTLHVYLNEPGAICDHSAPMVGHQMIVFEGPIIPSDQTVAQPSHDLWGMDEWLEETLSLYLGEGVKPEARKGQTTIRLNSLHSLLAFQDSRSWLSNRISCSSSVVRLKRVSVVTCSYFRLWPINGHRSSFITNILMHSLHSMTTSRVSRSVSFLRLKCCSLLRSIETTTDWIWLFSFDRREATGVASIQSGEHRQWISNLSSRSVESSSRDPFD